MSDTRSEFGAYYDLPSVVHVLRARAAERPTHNVFTYLLDGKEQEARLDYAGLDRAARRVAAELQPYRGARALLLYPPGLDYLIAYYGCLYAGVIAVPVYPPDAGRLARTLPRFVGIAIDAQASLVLTTAPLLAMAEMLFELAPSLRDLRWIATDTMPEGSEDTWKEPSIDGRTIAFLQYTSGSTGAPKGVIVSHENLRQNARVVRAAVPPTERSLVVNWAPMYHDLGLIGLGIICPLFFGIPIVMLSPLDFLRRPILWLRAVSRYRATNCGAPNFAYDLCVRRIRPDEREGLDLSSWEVALNGAEPVRAETIDRFTEAYAPYGFRREAFYPSYGLAEATLMVTGGEKLRTPVIRRFDTAALAEGRATEAPAGEGRPLVSSGHPLLENTIRIVDPETRVACAEGVVGEIWIGGPTVAGGYFAKEQETADTFQARLADTGEGPFLRTGDLAFVSAGELFVTSRLKDLVVIRGKKHHPHDIEATVERSHERLRVGCSAAFTILHDEEEALVVASEVDGREEADLDAIATAIRTQVSEVHGLRARHVVLLKSGSIFKTSSGKIQRRAVRDAFIGGTLEGIKKVV